MFEKVSFDVFDKDIRSIGGYIAKSDIEFMYNAIRLPSRSTEFSAGYDFFSPIGLHIPANVAIKIPTGIKVNLSTAEDSNMKKFLALYPRSSLGFKYGMRLMNTVGIIDQDYYNNPYNEGHIIVAITSMCEFDIDLGSKFCQGIIQPYYFIESTEKVDTKRIGGLGSTDEIKEEPVLEVIEEPKEPIEEEMKEQEEEPIYESDNQEGSNTNSKEETSRRTE